MTPADLKRSFKSALDKLRLELQTNLSGTDLLDDDAVKNTLDLFNQRLVIAQNDFLQFLAQAGGSCGGNEDRFTLDSVPRNLVPELASSILAGGGAVVLVNVLTVSGSSWLFFTTTTTAAAAAGALVGLSATVATAGIGAVAGVGAGVAINKSMKKKRIRKRREAILDAYDSEVTPKLQDWASKRIAEAGIA